MENTILNDLQGIFGDKAITFDDFKKGLYNNKIKLGNLSKGDYINKYEYIELQDKYKNLEAQNTELIKSSDKYQKDIEKLQKELDNNKISKEEYESSIKNLKDAHKTEIENIQKTIKEAEENSRLSNYLDKFNIAVNCKEFILSKLDKSLIKVDNNNVLGVDDQIKGFMETYPSLFTVSAQAGITPSASGTASASIGKDKQEQAEEIRNRFLNIK